MRGRRLAFFAIASATLLMSCACRASSDVNRPLTQAQVQSAAEFTRVNEIVSEFSRVEHFAVQVLPAPQPSTSDFSLRLFRDDLTLTVNRVRGGPIEIAAFPLCACELGRRFGLQTAADDAVSQLKKRLTSK
jgi:hypothetical protein